MSEKLKKQEEKAVVVVSNELVSKRAGESIAQLRLIW